MMKLIVLIISVLSLLSCTQTAVYVSTNGSDYNSGTKSNPVITVQKAVDISRKTGIKKIEIQEGEYFDVSVILNAQDSGLNISGAPGKNVKLIGGKIITGWQQSGNLFEYQMPDSLLANLDFRILIVNDTLRDRARLPETGAFNHLSEWPVEWQSSQGG